MEKLRPALLSTLLELVKLKAHTEFVHISSTELATKLGQSQQAASQHLRELEREGLIERRRNGVRHGTRLTTKGSDAIRAYYAEMRVALEGKTREMSFSGNLFRGLGEGAYYIDLPGYKKQFVKLLGFVPYPGTLNIKLVTTDQMEQKRQLRSLEGLRVEGFENGTRTYGGARCYRALVNGRYPAAVLVIDRTHYDDSVMEVISPVNFRKELGLEEGNKVDVRVFL